MKKKYLLLISLLFVTINVDASNGICDDRPSAANGYCLLENPITDNKNYQDGYNFENGTTTTKLYHHANIEGQTVDLYCLDPNRKDPSVLQYGKELSVENGAYDAGLIKMHQIYLAERLQNSYVDINTAVRFFVPKMGMAKSGGSPTPDSFYNGGDVFEELSPSKSGAGITTILPQEEYEEKYGASYAQARAIYCAGRLAKGTSASCANYLSTNGYGGIYTAETKDYNVEFVVDGEPQDVSDSSNDFHKKVNVKIEGIDDINSAITSYGLQYLNPKITFKGLKCSKATCKSDLAEGTDLLNSRTNSFVIEVYGSNKDIANDPKITVEIEYDYFFPFGASGVGILVNEPSESFQRMLGYLDSMTHKLTFDLEIKLQNVCRTEENNYYVGSKKVEINEYISAGCCEGIDSSSLTEAQKDIYKEQCNDEDVVVLVADCNGECDENGNVNNEPSDSYVDQVDYDKLLKKVKTNEKKVMDKKITLTDYSNYTKNALKYWRDDEFEKDLENNEYCKIYTTEDNHMIYPMTTASTSGRFFVFAKGSDGQYSQPEVKGEITAFFNTAYDIWKRDYIAMIQEEKRAFQSWQEGENYKDAVDHATTTGTGDCCTVEDEEDGNCTRGTDTYDIYEGTAEGTYYNGVYHSSPQGKKDAKWTEGGSCGGSKPDTSYVAELKKDYLDKVGERKILETKKKDCQEANKKFNESWKYILDPDLTFTYTQQYYDSVSGNTKVVEQEVEFIKAEGTSDEEGLAKYWPKTSQLPSKTQSSSYNTTVNFNGKDKAKYEGAIYGKESSSEGTTETGCNEPFLNVDETKADDPNSSQTWNADLYYRPTVGYYSLVPSGLYITNQEYSSGTDALNIGYVFNVQITNYQGKYRTWFTIKNNGHLELEPKANDKNESNVQYRINEKLNNGNPFESLCVYCNREVIYDRYCPTCCIGPDCENDPDKFYPNYVYRTINPSNMDPNNRKDSGDLGNNWSDAKGGAAESRIRQIGLKDGMFDDSADSETLEYVFNLDTKTMQEIKKYNKSTNYYDWNSTNGVNSAFSCASDGKECISSFVTKYASNTAGRQKYKYYIDGTFKEGTIKQLLPGGYPDVELDDEGKIYP